jgi:hypothetical protein
MGERLHADRGQRTKGSLGTLTGRRAAHSKPEFNVVLDIQVRKQRK